MRTRHKITSFVVVVVFVLALTGGSGWAAVYRVDPNHTTVSFKIRHLFSNVQGVFTRFDGTIDYEPGKPETWRASGTIDVNSINTNVAQRDAHLRSPDFFDAARYPTIAFKSAGVTDAADTNGKLRGLLTMHGVEKPVVLDVKVLGVGKDPRGNTRAGFTATTRINRKDFGLNWNQALETGGFLVGDEVDITLDIEAAQIK